MTRADARIAAAKAVAYAQAGERGLALTMLKEAIGCLRLEFNIVTMHVHSLLGDKRMAKGHYGNVRIVLPGRSLRNEIAEYLHKLSYEHDTPATSTLASDIEDRYYAAQTAYEEIWRA